MTSQRKGETAEEYAVRQTAIHPEVRRRTIVLVHALVQALLAMGLLELRPWKPRTVGAIGVVASVLNCYMLYPSVPKPWFSGLFSGKVKVAQPQVAAPPQPASHAKAL